MNILVTGGSGYIGSHTCVELLENGYEVVIADNLSNSSEESLNRIEKISGKRPLFYRGDVCDYSFLEKIFSENSIDAVIHFAGLKAVGESVGKPLLYYRNNLDSTITLLQAMLDYEVHKIVFSSSATVYSGDNEMPLSETSRTGNCTNPYGWSKYMNEVIIRDTVNAYPELSAVLLRYFNPVGAHKSGLMGEDPKGIPNNLMPFICQTAVGRIEKLSVFGNDYDTKDGTGIRDYIHVVDLAKGHVAALKYMDAHRGTEIFNLGTGQGTSVLELVDAFEKTNNVKVPYTVTERRPGDLATVFADVTKSNIELNWKAEHSIRDMCRDGWNWQVHNPHGYSE